MAQLLGTPRPMTHQALRELDVRPGKAVMACYRAAQAKYQGEIGREDVDQAEAGCESCTWG